MGQRGRDFESRLGAGGFEFPGPWGVSISRNITSSKDKGIGAWSDDEIKRAIINGVSRDGSKLNHRWAIIITRRSLQTTSTQSSPICAPSPPKNRAANRRRNGS